MASATQSSTVVSALVLQILEQRALPPRRHRPVPVDDVDLSKYAEPRYYVNNTRKPSNPIVTEDQVRFLNALHGLGFPGLVEELITWCSERLSSTDHAERGRCWDVIADDGDEGNLYELLLQLPKDVLKYLIKGIFPRKIKKDSAVNQFYTHNMMPQIEICGSYANQVCHVQSGRWLPPSILGNLVRDAKRYARGLAIDDVWASWFDNTFTKATRVTTAIPKPPGPGFRRYAGTQAKKDNLVLLANAIQQDFVDNTSAADRASERARVPTEVGWARDIKKRLQDHTRNYLTADLLGFFRAWVRKMNQDGELDAIELLQMQLFVALSDSDRDVAGMTESVATALFGALMRKVGWNTVPPYITQFSVSSTAYAAALRFATSSRVIENAEADVINSVKLFKSLNALETLSSRLGSLKSTRDDLMAQLADLNDDIREQEEDIDRCKDDFNVARADRRRRLRQLPTTTKAEREDERDTLLARVHPKQPITFPQHLITITPWKPEFAPKAEKRFAERMEELRHARAQTVYAAAADGSTANFSQSYTPQLDTQTSEPSSPIGGSDEDVDVGSQSTDPDEDAPGPETTAENVDGDLKELRAHFAVTQKLLSMSKLPKLTKFRPSMPPLGLKSLDMSVQLKASRRMHRDDMARGVTWLVHKGTIPQNWVRVKTIKMMTTGSMMFLLF